VTAKGLGKAFTGARGRQGHGCWVARSGETRNVWIGRVRGTVHRQRIGRIKGDVRAKEQYRLGYAESQQVTRNLHVK
jgi:hypothetical protein